MAEDLQNRNLRRLKIILLISSLVSLALLLMAAFEEQLGGEWRRHQSAYRAASIQHATSDVARKAAESIEIGFAQVFLPELNRIDRCVTCHAGIDDPRQADAEQPLRTHSGDIFKHHPLEKFGCTVCHDGQGRAVATAAAHGEVPHWSAPLLRGDAVYTSCGRCHYENDLFGWEEDRYARGGVHDPLDQAELAASIPGGADAHENPITRGKKLVLSSGCLGCHKYRGRGGTLGPDITYVGDKTRHDFDFRHIQGEHTVAQWLFEHFKRPGDVTPGTLMPNMDLTDAAARDLTAYMRSLHRKTMPASHTPIPPRREGKRVIGRQLYAMFCSGCHGPRGQGATVRDPQLAADVDAPRELLTPSLNNLDTLAVASNDYLRRIITNGRRDTSMIAWRADAGGLNPEEIDALVRYIRNWEGNAPPADSIAATRGNPRFGRALYRSRCAGCHGRHGQGGIGVALRSPSFLAVASDTFLARAIVHGRPNTAMPSWKQLNADQVNDILAYIRTWEHAPADKAAVLARLSSGKKPGRRARRVGKLLYRSRCATCHGPNGEGAIGPSLNNDAFLSIVDNDYLYTAIVQGRPGTAMPSWKHLSADDVVDLINHLRSWNQDNRRRLEAYVAHGDWDPGRILFEGICVGCHGAQAEGRTGPQLNNPVFLASVSDAMLREWISHGKPNTAMRAFLKGRQGVVELAAAQIDDIVAYLRRLEGRPRVVSARPGMGIVPRGADVFAATCSGCHGRKGEGLTGSGLSNPAFLQAASDGFLEATIVLGRDGTEMRSMGKGLQGNVTLSAENVSNVVAFIRSWEHRPPISGIPARYVMAGNLTEGQTLYAGNCAGCHGTHGNDGWAPALNNRDFLAAASDGFLQATIVRGRAETAMRPFGIGGGGVAELSGEQINNIVAYIRTWAASENRPAASPTDDRKIERKAEVARLSLMKSQSNTN